MNFQKNFRLPSICTLSTRLGIPLVSVGLFLLLRELLQPYLGVEAPLLIFLFAVMVSAWFGGLWSGILATLLGATAGVYYFIEPTHSFHVSHVSDAIRVFLFVSEGFLLSVLNGLLLSAQVRLKRSLVEEIKAKGAAEEANRTKSRFLANMSHEIRTPMTSILGFTDVLKASGFSNKQRLHYIETIQRNGELLLGLIDDLLDISRIEAKKLNIEFSTVDVDTLVTDTIHGFEPMAKKKGIQLKFDIGLSVPKLIYTDQLRLRQILNNLINNAIKFSRKGVVSLSVRMSADQLGVEQITFAVKDGGIGMSKEQIERLFKMFSQGDSSISREFGGTGLGLAISRHLARKLGGDLWLEESSLGQGSVFAASVSPNLEIRKELKAPECNHSEASTGSLNGIKILLADDCEDLRELFTTFLVTKGALVMTVADGEKAVQAALSNSYDVVLMDVEMPTLDGCSATRKLRLRGYSLPIIALTAHAMAESQTRCIEVGYDDVIVKPVSPQKLIERILHHCEEEKTPERTHLRPLENL